ncbi:MAG TPA: histidinol-phosphate aminotransferase family protein [Caldithrix abyssi]|uniref:Histidinol-phosphate aminotransferase family protein n=1 Tax=Caldithrix abyssi TaxID=187145 RepID=A0A7V4WWI1_CALAY|nr:histidinol-phosphate aminotransferase family protein [Caldithrix abyssi]
MSFPEHNTQIIYLDRNENNYGPAPACLEILNNIDHGLLNWYTRAHEKSTKGELYARLAKDYNLSEDRVVLGYGGEDLLKQVIHCYLGKGETLFVPQFSWWYYKSIADEVEGITVEFPLYPGEEAYHYDVDGLLEMYEQHKPRILFISSPNNPTGNTLSPEELQRVLDKTKEAVVVLDEAYALFKTTDLSYVTEIINSYPNTMVIRTFSKYYALAGLRVGFALIGKGLTRFERFSSRYLGYNRLTEAIALAALDSPQYYADITAKMNADKDMFFEEFSRLPGFKPYRSDANFMLIDMEKSQMAPLKKYLTERGIIIKFMNEKVLNSQLRITIGQQDENRKLMDAIKAYVAVKEAV